MSKVKLNQYDESMVNLFARYLATGDAPLSWYEDMCSLLCNYIRNKKDSMWMITKVEELEDGSE